MKYAVDVMGVTPGATDEETALAGIAAMEEFYHRIGMPINFKELGIAPTDEQIAEMAASCARACAVPRAPPRCCTRAIWKPFIRC